MAPLHESGLMTGVMTHSLDALRCSADLLLTTMDVFIKEPSLDWRVGSQLHSGFDFRLLFLLYVNFYVYYVCTIFI